MYHYKLELLCVYAFKCFDTIKTQIMINRLQTCHFGFVI